MTDPRSEHSERSDDDSPRRGKRSPEAGKNVADAGPAETLPCWPFPVGSQNNTDKAVTLKPYVPPKRRTLNQY